MSFLVQEQVALAPKTTLKTGGNAAFYTEVTTVDELEKAVSFAQEKGLPFYVLGGGSNLLVSDAGYTGLIIRMAMLGRDYGQLQADTQELTVSAGENFDAVVAETTTRGLWGLENLSSIPGSVGATPVQNVGAYGVEVADIISRVTAFDVETKKIIPMLNTDCLFSYRHSIFKDKKNYIIVSVTFLLSVKPNPKLTYADLAKLEVAMQTPLSIRDRVIAIRANKFPDWNLVGTAGSFFKNPIITVANANVLLQKYPDIPTYPELFGKVKLSLGYILDTVCGLKGFAVGSVRLYEKQALVLVAGSGATTTDIKNFKKIISDAVFLKTGIIIEQEVTEI